MTPALSITRPPGLASGHDARVEPDRGEVIGFLAPVILTAPPPPRAKTALEILDDNNAFDLEILRIEVGHLRALARHRRRAAEQPRLHLTQFITEHVVAAWEDIGTLGGVARALGCSRNLVRSHLRRAGIRPEAPTGRPPTP